MADYNVKEIAYGGNNYKMYPANLTSETQLNNASQDATETPGRIYPVRMDANGKLAVNVPWTGGGGGGSDILTPSAAFAIPEAGDSVSYVMDGMTASHELIRWNFSSSAENSPPTSLTWTTYSGYFTITNNGVDSDETICPVFAGTEAKTITPYT